MSRVESSGVERSQAERAVVAAVALAAIVAVVLRGHVAVGKGLVAAWPHALALALLSPALALALAPAVASVCWQSRQLALYGGLPQDKADTEPGHELIAGAASFAAMRAYEQHQDANGYVRLWTRL